MEDNQESGNIVASQRVRLSVGVSLITVLSGGGFGLFKWIEPIRPWLVYLTTGLALVGLAFLLKQLASHPRAETEDQVLHFLHDAGFWGACLMLSAGSVFVVVTLFEPLLDPPVKQVFVRVNVPPSINPVVEFPELTIGGVTLNGKRSSAIIGKRPVCLGEEVAGVRIILIFEDGVITEKDGVRKVYYRNTTHGVILSAEDVICGIDSPTNGSGSKPAWRN